MRRVLSIVFWSLIIAGVGSLFIFANQRQKKLICPKFEIEVEYNNAQVLITQGNIRQLITRNDIKVRGNEVGQIEIEKIQKLLDANPFLKKATITIGVNGVVQASVIQRNPVVRVVDLQGKQCYIDEEGSLMPLSPEFPARVIIASGNIKPLGQISKSGTKKNNSLPYKSLSPALQQIYNVSLALKSDAFCDALVEQIYVNEANEIELFPKIGHQKIILGDSSRIEEKLKNLKVFYTDGMKTTGWNTYKSINLKYRNQVVCTKTK